MERKRYPTDLTDDQWEILEWLLPPEAPGGRPRSVDLREVVNTLLYQARTGCQWDMLPHDLVPKSTAYDYFARWRGDGTWQAILDALRPRAAGPQRRTGTQCRQHRQPERQDRRRRRGTGLRRRQENHWAQAAHCGRHAGAAAGGGGHQRGGGRCGGGTRGLPATDARRASSTGGRLGGRQVPQPRAAPLAGTSAVVAVATGDRQPSAGHPGLCAVA